MGSTIFARDILHQIYHQGVVALARFIERYGRIEQAEIASIFEKAKTDGAIHLAIWGDLTSKYAYWADYMAAHIVSIDDVQSALADVLRMMDSHEQHAKAFHATGAQVLIGHHETDQDRYQRYISDLESVLQKKTEEMRARSKTI